MNLYTLTICQLLVSIDYQIRYQIKAYTKGFYPLVRYLNDLTLIFMNNYENMRHKKKMVEKIRVGGGGVHTALPKCQLLTIVDCQTCYQIKFKT